MLLGQRTQARLENVLAEPRRRGDEALLMRHPERADR